MRYSIYLLTSLCVLSACTGNTLSETEFTQRVKSLCGNAYAGEIVSTDSEDDAWRAEDIIMHVRDCSDDEIKIALHVGDDRSRTWILRREDGQFALRHDHRHEDGSPDALTFYGGFAAQNSSGSRMNFPADQSTKDLFDREGIPVSKSNIWAMEVRPSHQLFAYEMVRPNRFFRVEFDTGETVETPPTPWGW